MVSVYPLTEGLSEAEIVLILISVEDGFCVQSSVSVSTNRAVLILISVEDGFCELPDGSLTPSRKGLNPYFCGRWFLCTKKKESAIRNGSLNPYFCGRWFL